jgi:spore coat polysaccharide biosynthesis protein SpsF
MNEKRKIFATIEARMTSTRLPGKVLMEVLGKPMLELMIERLRRIPELDGVILCTTVNKTDNKVADLAERLGVNCHRGSEEDVMLRVLDGAKAYGADIIVETTGDCPLIDPDISGQVLRTYLFGSWDFVANNTLRSYPIGMDTRVFSTATLADAASRTDAPYDHEHVSTFMPNHPELYSCLNLAAPTPFHDPELRLTLDTPEDFRVISAIFEELYPQNPDFRLAEMLDLLRRRPELRAISAHVQQKKI